jgi:hypothetical protein
MNTSPAHELPISRPAPTDSPRDASHRFFVGLGLFCMLLAAIGFAPSFYDHFTGELTIPAAVHVHGAVMFSWLILFTTQANLAARANMRLHRRLGWIAVGAAAAIVISMSVATVMALQRFDPEQMGFLVQPLLIQLGSIAVFPIFVAWAVAMRRQPMWHKRLMALATMVLVQAALDRMHWMPETSLPMFWHAGLRLYVLLLLPLLLFDALTLKRIHPATLAGAAIVVAMHAVVSFYWTQEGWRQLALSFWIWLR